MKSTRTKAKSLTTTLFSKHKTVPAEPANAVVKFLAPSAKQVFVAGTFNNWQSAAIPLKPAQGGEWRGELKLPPGRHEYLFVVDGKWLPDPAARDAVPNPFGGFNSIISIG